MFLQGQRGWVGACPRERQPGVSRTPVATAGDADDFPPHTVGREDCSQHRGGPRPAGDTPLWVRLDGGSSLPPGPVGPPWALGTALPKGCSKGGSPSGWCSICKFAHSLNLFVTSEFTPAALCGYLGTQPPGVARPAEVGWLCDAACCPTTVGTVLDTASLRPRLSHSVCCRWCFWCFKLKRSTAMLS